MKRRLFLAGSVSAALAACGPIGNKLNETSSFHALLERAEGVNESVIGTRGHAKLYNPRDISAALPIDSLDTPSDSQSTQLLARDFQP
jgi:hypothetical protein